MDETAPAFGDRLRGVFHLLEEGCVPRQIDSALTAAGWNEGPLARLDTIGIDVFRARWMAPGGISWSAIPDRLLAMGRVGRRSQAGFYLYTAAVSSALRDPEIEAMIVAHSAEIGVARREITAAEIVRRCGDTADTATLHGMTA